MKDLSYIRVFPKFYCAASVANDELEFVISDDSRNLTGLEMSIFTEAMIKVQKVFNEKRCEGAVMSPVAAEALLSSEVIALTKKIKGEQATEYVTDNH